MTIWNSTKLCPIAASFVFFQRVVMSCITSIVYINTKVSIIEKRYVRLLTVNKYRIFKEKKNREIPKSEVSGKRK